LFSLTYVLLIILLIIPQKFLLFYFFTLSLFIFQKILLFYFFLLCVCLILVVLTKFTNFLPWFKLTHTLDFYKKKCILCGEIYKKQNFMDTFSCYLLVRLYRVEEEVYKVFNYFKNLLSWEKLFNYTENNKEVNVLHWVFLEYFEDSNFFYLNHIYRKFHYNKYIYYYNYYYNWQECYLSIEAYYKFYNSFNITFTNYHMLNFPGMFLTYKNKIPVFSKIFFINIFFIFKSLLLPLIITFFLFVYTIIYFQVNFWRQLATWLIIGLLFFWLISGFNFFLKRYSFGKFTSAITRFWKRTNIYFWLVEGFLFTLFFYYYLNSSQEPCYMLDSSSLNQSYLPNLSNIYINSFILIATIAYYYYWTLNFPNFTVQQTIFSVLIITVYFLYTYIIESYQFYYTITLFFETIWNYLHEFNVWIQEYESPRLRVKHQYLILALIAKYWHFIFIFISWVFFALKIFEQKRSFYTHSGVNLQNLFILFWLNFLVVVQWFKWVERRFLDSSYYWFFTDSNYLFYFSFLSEFNALVKYCVLHIFLIEATL